jgi:hypothetical protein
LPGFTWRAEPVSALYEHGMMHHIGTFPQLKDRMTNFTPDFDRRAIGYSSDRVDALVWAATDLLIEPMSNWGLFELYRRRAVAIEAKNHRGSSANQKDRYKQTSLQEVYGDAKNQFRHLLQNRP